MHVGIQILVVIVLVHCCNNTVIDNHNGRDVAPLKYLQLRDSEIFKNEDIIIKQG